MDRAQLLLVALPLFLFCSDIFNLFSTPPAKPAAHHHHNRHHPDSRLLIQPQQPSLEFSTQSVAYFHHAILQYEYYRRQYHDLRVELGAVKSRREDLMQVKDLQVRLHEMVREMKVLEEKSNQVATERESLRLQVIELTGQVDALKREDTDQKQLISELQAQVRDLSPQKQAAYEAGEIAGQGNFISSPEYHNALKNARLDGAGDFLESQSFQTVLSDRRAKQMYFSFYNCQNQLIKLGGIVPGFDLSQLDPTKDDNLKEISAEGNGAGIVPEDEFALLLKDSPDENMEA